MDFSTDGEAPVIAGNFPGFEALTTPRVVVSEAVLATNIARMQSIATAGQVALHPHIKTHKSLALARRQLAAGASGLTTSRPEEATIFIAAGLGPVTIAYPVVDPSSAARLLRLGADHGVALRFIVDSLIGLEALEAASFASGLKAESFVKVDVGLHRCGIDSLAPAGLAVVRQLASSPVRFLGLLAHAGNAYAAGSRDGVLKAAQQERDLLLGLRDRLQTLGIEVPTISVGSTPTALANAGFDGFDELRPGNYVFLDLSAIRLGIAAREDIALAVVATVLSANAEFSIIDAGSKTLSSDLGPHGIKNTLSFGEVWHPGWHAPLEIIRLSEEHGFVANDGPPLKPGTKVLVLPNHACPVANLSQGLAVLAPGGTAELAVEAASARLG